MAVIESDYIGFGIDPLTGKRHPINHLPVNPEWEEGIYQLEEGDSVIGGLKGIDNLPLQQLANRTEYLKGKADSFEDKIEELESRNDGASIAVLDVTIPAEGWVKDDNATSGWPYYIDIQNESITEDTLPALTISLTAMTMAQEAGIAPVVQTLNKALRVFAQSVPKTEIPASLALFGASYNGEIPKARIPVASASVAGGVKVQTGSGLVVDKEGNISIDTATTQEVIEIYEKGGD